MPVNKLLSRIRASIKDLTPALDPFMDENIQPGAEDCTRLQQCANDLLELIGAYKYTKQNNELSPSFNLHAHISETVENMQQDVIPKPESPSSPAPEPPKAEIKEKVQEQAQPKN